MLDWLFPAKCAFCGATLSSGASLEACGPCVSGLPYFNGEFLFDASRGDWRGANEGGADRKSDGSRAAGACDVIACAFKYEGAVSAALARFKFCGKPELGRALAAFVADAVERRILSSASYAAHSSARGGRPPLPRYFDITTCVPASKPRLRERGYNQADEVARLVARRLGCRYDSRLLARSSGSARQSSLSRREREENAIASFGCGKARHADVEGAAILLVDDIATTFSTLFACARLLKAAGASYVAGAVVAARMDRRRGV